jgi:hypothetical protein
MRALDAPLLPSRIQSDILFAEIYGKTCCRNEENAKAGVAWEGVCRSQAPHKDQIMSVSAISPLPVFQPLNPALGTNNNDNNKKQSNGPSEPNGTNTSNAAGQAQGPRSANGGDNDTQTSGTAATETNPPNQQPQLPKTGQGTGVTINILV